MTFPLHQALNGVVPGATEWTHAPMFGSWYREQGDWAAIIDESGEPYKPKWWIHVWLKGRGLGEPKERNRMSTDSVPCYWLNPYDDVTLAKAKQIADEMLSARNARRTEQ
jgi:hypothetical protein